MQLMIDILVETPASLRLAAEFLNNHASLREAMEGTPAAPVAGVPVAAHTHATATVAPTVPEPQLFDSQDLARAQHEMNMPNAAPAPFVPPAPAPFVPAPPAPGMNPNMTAFTAPAAVAPAIPTASNVLPHPATPPATSGPDEFDKAGVPFDARIHQKSRNKKKDGTWKIQKGLDAAVVTAVMQELAPRIRTTPTAPSVPAVGLHVGGSGQDQGSVAPPAPAPVLAPPPPVNPAVVFGQTPLPVGAPAPVPLPRTQANFEAHPQAFGAPTIQAPAVPGAPAQTQDQGQAQNQGQAVDPFRALVRKITEAKNAGKISPEEVTSCVASSGAPSLQLLNNMPHLIPAVDAALDVLLATR